MAEFKKIIITTKGQELMAKMIAGNGSIEFTKIDISEMEYNEENIESLTTLDDVKQTALVNNVEITNGVAVQVEAMVTNTDLKVGYHMKTVGLYARDGEKEILYAVSIASVAGWMPPYNGLTVSGAFFKLVTTVGNANNVSLEVNPAALATISNLKILQPKEDLGLQTTSKTVVGAINELHVREVDLSDYYTKSQVDSKVSAKLDSTSFNRIIKDNTITLAIGSTALANNTTGEYNTAVGLSALRNNTTGRYNTAVGNSALHSNTTGNYNTAVGSSALQSNSTGNNNTAISIDALLHNTTGSNNTAIGRLALGSNVTGSNNTAINMEALNKNTTGYDNTAVGISALKNNTTGNYNTAVGTSALLSNTTGSYNLALGYQALRQNTTSNANVAIGTYSLANNTGVGNVAVGCETLEANTTGQYNTAIGHQALESNFGSYNVAIGYQAGQGYSMDRTIFLGNNQISSIRCNVTSITSLSDKRTKTDIVPADLDICLNNVKNLPLHHFAYEDWASKRADKHGLGWIAQEVEQVFPKSVITEERLFDKLDENGEPIKIKKSVATLNDEGDEVQEEQEVTDTFCIADCKSFTPTEILPTLWGAMQKLIGIVENQQEQIDILKKEVEGLKIK